MFYHILIENKIQTKAHTNYTCIETNNLTEEMDEIIAATNAGRKVIITSDLIRTVEELNIDKDYIDFTE